MDGYIARVRYGYAGAVGIGDMKIFDSSAVLAVDIHRPRVDVRRRRIERRCKAKCRCERQNSRNSM